MTSYWQIAVNAPIDSILTYKTNELELTPGESVVVPLGKRKVDGVVINSAEPSSEFEMKDIIEKHAERPLLFPHQLEWLQWLAKYYCYPLGQIAQLCFAPLKKTGRGSRKPSVIPDQPLDSPPQLTDEQKKVYEDIRSHSDFSVHLLHGVTGSGKTEVYLHLLADTLKKGKRGLVLVPEISLTPQLIDRFSRRFGPEVAVIHSHLTEREKTDQWWSIVDKKKKILIGARSAMFCPLSDLDLIILDEEHEPSFKQEEKLKYHARDAAVYLAQKANCPVVLGSATPSMETWQNAKSGKYKLHKMNHRVANRAMPEVEMVDLRQGKDVAIENTEEKLPELPFWLSPQLYLGLKDSLSNGWQSALFLNRRGVAQTVTCPSCGTTSECPNCAVSLTLHGQKHLVCHYCGYHEDRADVCKACGDGEPQPIGLGTELVEDDLRKLFPKARIARADRDEISTRQELEELIQNMENGEIDFLVGTQMIAKGLDFKNLRMVGLVLADIGFNLPDFRSGERIFQLVTQVSGRAGRHIEEGEAPGRVIVQTFNPDHPILQLALKADFDAFAEYELNMRQALNYPPLGRMAAFRIQAPELKTSRMAATQIVEMGDFLKGKHEAYGKIQLLGPVEAPLLKLRGQYRHQVLVKCDSPWTLVQFCHHIIGNKDKWPKKTKVAVDMDPMSLL